MHCVYSEPIYLLHIMCIVGLYTYSYLLCNIYLNSPPISSYLLGLMWCSDDLRLQRPLLHPVCVDSPGAKVTRVVVCVCLVCVSGVCVTQGERTELTRNWLTEDKNRFNLWSQSSLISGSWFRVIADLQTAEVQHLSGRPSGWLSKLQDGVVMSPHLISHIYISDFHLCLPPPVTLCCHWPFISHYTLQLTTRQVAKHSMYLRTFKSSSRNRWEVREKMQMHAEMRPNMHKPWG